MNARCTSTITVGRRPMPRLLNTSAISARPGPDVAVMALAPPIAAPIIMLDEAISLSAWTNTLPSCGRRREIYSSISVCGVMG